jgi:hypothetical protein
VAVVVLMPIDRAVQLDQHRAVTAGIDDVAEPMAAKGDRAAAEAVPAGNAGERQASSSRVS